MAGARVIALYPLLPDRMEVGRTEKGELYYCYLKDGQEYLLRREEVLMSPTAMLMIHNPATFIWGEEADMQKGIEMLSEVKEAIINAFEAKTGLKRTQIAKMMDAETWVSAGRAVELGFADEILYSKPPLQVTDFMFDEV